MLVRLILNHSAPPRSGVGPVAFPAAFTATSRVVQREPLRMNAWSSRRSLISMYPLVYRSGLLWYFWGSVSLAGAPPNPATDPGRTLGSAIPPMVGSVIVPRLVLKCAPVASQVTVAYLRLEVAARSELMK